MTTLNLGTCRRWHRWTGVSGLLYASRLRRSPPVVFRDTTLDGLRQQIRDWEAEHPPVILG